MTGATYKAVSIIESIVLWWKLRKLARSASADHRLALMAELERLDDPKAIPALVGRMRHDQDARIRLAAARALDKRGWRSADAAEHMVLAISSGRLEDFAEYPPPSNPPIDLLVHAFRHGNWLQREAAADALVHLGWTPDTAGDRAMLMLLHGKPDQAVQEGPGIVPEVLEALRRGNKGIRCSALKVLAELADRRATQDLCTTLVEDEHTEVRQLAAQALGRIRDRSAVDTLIRALRYGNAPVQCEALKALAAIGDCKAIPAIIEAMQDSELVELGRQAIDSIQEASGIPEHELLNRIGTAADRVRRARTPVVVGEAECCVGRTVKFSKEVERGRSYSLSLACGKSGCKGVEVEFSISLHGGEITGVQARTRTGIIRQGTREQGQEVTINRKVNVEWFVGFEVSPG